MYKRVYYATITAKSYWIYEKNHEFPTVIQLSETTEEFFNLESLLKWVKENKWEVGEKWKFKKNIWWTDTDIKKGHKTLPIKEIKIYAKTEKSFTNIEELLPEKNYEEKKHVSIPMIVEWIEKDKQGNVTNTYTVYTDGRDYPTKVEAYKRERGINPLIDEDTDVTIRFAKVIKKKNVIV